MHGQVRDIVLVKKKNKINLLFLQNNEFPVLYELKNSKEKK
jgi:sporulation protein YlmC with PRC-barrel domain